MGVRWDRDVGICLTLTGIEYVDMREAQGGFLGVGAVEAVGGLFGRRPF